ncbi:MAG: guanylate kinase [Candidatus Omnitrophica bacterium]|nr:guanylate kinase [Candidatus Omnitrophota bacterium]
MSSRKTDPRVIILSGPSGAGKTTLHDRLLAAPRFAGKLVRSVSATTRQPRGQEQEGRDYFFVSVKMFEARIKRGAFLEWARVFDNYYGTPLKYVRENLKQGKSVLLCIDVQGGRQIKQKLPEAVAIFVKTPTIAELGRRLTARKTDSKASVALRLETAGKELKEACFYDHVLVNDDLARAGQELEALVAGYIGG